MLIVVLLNLQGKKKTNFPADCSGLSGPMREGPRDNGHISGELKAVVMGFLRSGGIICGLSQSAGAGGPNI